MHRRPPPAESRSPASGGRPRKVDAAAVGELRAAGCGPTEIGRRLQVSRWTIYRAIRRLPPPGCPQDPGACP